MARALQKAEIVMTEVAGQPVSAKTIERVTMSAWSWHSAATRPQEWPRAGDGSREQALLPFLQHIGERVAWQPQTLIQGDALDPLTFASCTDIANKARSTWSIRLPSSPAGGTISIVPCNCAYALRNARSCAMIIVDSLGFKEQRGIVLPQEVPFCVKLASQRKFLYFNVLASAGSDLRAWY